MPDDATMPEVTVNSAGAVAAGATLFGGPYEGPLTIQETNLTFLRVTRPLTIKDAIAYITATGLAAAQVHAYLVCVDNVQNVVGILFAAQLQPGSAQRHAQALKIPAGHDLLIKAVQLTGAAAEATTLIINWA